MIQPASSDTLTQGIRVTAEARFLPDQSDTEHHQFVYAYKIKIKNEGTERAKLKTRHWIILDADNNRQDVRGAGVVGKHPDLAPGEQFEYESGCPLRTRWGTMEGSYTFERAGGATFTVDIGRFFLVPPSAARVRS
jgi:ApaG protein